MKSRDIYISNTPLAEALDLWHQALADLGLGRQVEKIPVDDCLGRVTAEPVFAPRSTPFYNAAAMDGICVRFRDTVGASEAAPIRLTPGQFIEVNTGNAVPQGFDAVIMIEDIQRTDDSGVEIIAGATPWQHVRTIGEDIVATELILPEGHTIRPIDLGAMLATGVDTVTVHAVPSVLVIPTGSDVVQPGEELEPGKIIEFNSRILAGYLQEWGAEARRGQVVADDPLAIKEALLAGVADHDLVIINAGASAGAKDFTASVLAGIGRVIVHGVNIKPGKPVILAIVQGKPVIGLPGYPVSAVLTQRLFVKELIHTALGQASLPPDLHPAVLSRPISSRMGVEDFIRVKLGRVNDTLIATPTGRGAGAVMTLVQADGILTIPAGSEGIGGGETVPVELLRPLDEVDNTLVFIGSHDNILDVLANMLHKLRPVIRLSSAHVGSMGGIMAIRRGEAHIAGTHLVDEESGEYNIPFIQKYLAGIPLKLINLAYREQGFLVQRNNPKNIKDFEDLTRDDVRFINRQQGSGTRILFDLNLKKQNIPAARINGYDREEYTHMNIASAVASGSADTGLAIRAAAHALDLDFIPVASERYDLIMPIAHQDDPRVRALLETIRHNEKFRNTVTGLGGYDLRDCGRVMYEQ
ncbi:MAG: molybdopterin biosynthesis protein [Desulfobacterales bacterium]|nr:molybdopterin biosynthesis protein [Desulfobacterales bacterium]